MYVRLRPLSYVFFLQFLFLLVGISFAVCFVLPEPKGIWDVLLRLVLYLVAGVATSHMSVAYLSWIIDFGSKSNQRYVNEYTYKLNRILWIHAVLFLITFCLEGFFESILVRCIFRTLCIFSLTNCIFAYGSIQCLHVLRFNSEGLEETNRNYQDQLE